MDYIINVAKWIAMWKCPGCSVSTHNTSAGVETLESCFDVICSDCEYEYLVSKKEAKS